MREEYLSKLDKSLSDVKDELLRAKSIYPDYFSSSHEAYAVILEEIDELWDEIKKKDCSEQKQRTEAIQSAAMLLRYLVEIL